MGDPWCSDHDEGAWDEDEDGEGGDDLPGSDLDKLACGGAKWWQACCLEDEDYDGQSDYGYDDQSDYGYDDTGSDAPMPMPAMKRDAAGEGNHQKARR